MNRTSTERIELEPVLSVSLLVDVLCNEYNIHTYGITNLISSSYLAMIWVSRHCDHQPQWQCTAVKLVVNDLRAIALASRVFAW